MFCSIFCFCKSFLKRNQSEKVNKTPIWSLVLMYKHLARGAKDLPLSLPDLDYVIIYIPIESNLCD